jgi:hypothetical protein
MRNSIRGAMGGKTFVFIGGLHRSGTSLLHQILREHGQVSGFRDTRVPEDEGQHLQTVYPPAREFGGPGRFGFNRRSFMDESHPLARDTSARRLFEQWSRYWDTDKDYLIEKSPPNLVRTRFLQAVFPNSAFIVLLRHPIAVAYATKKFSRWSSVKSLVEHSLVCYERFITDAPFLDRIHLVKYEDFVRRPQQAIGEICRFIGIQNVSVAAAVRQDLNENYFRAWERDTSGWRGRLFRKALPTEFEDRAQRLGYSLMNPRSAVNVQLLGSDQRGNRGGHDRAA